MTAKNYYIYNAPPPAHWYQRSIGWFGKTLLGSLLLSTIIIGGLTYTFAQNNVRARASTANQPIKPETAKASTLPPVAAQNIVDLQSVLDTWSAEHPNQKWGIVVKSLEGPSFSASLNNDKEFQSASIYKLFLTLPLFNQVPVEHQKGATVTINAKQKSLATCVDLMLRVSNNECGEAVGDYVNWQKADKVLAERGFRHTVFGKSSYLKTSAGDTAAFLEGLYGDMFNRTAKDTIMASLKQQRLREGIPSGCPGCIVANKTGSIDNVMHDAAIVEYQGGTYVLTIFSEGGSFKQIAQLTGQIQQRILNTIQ